jgi:hypothetical protein
LPLLHDAVAAALAIHAALDLAPEIQQQQHWKEAQYFHLLVWLSLMAGSGFFKPWSPKS